MPDYFAVLERRERLVAAAQARAGTPFMEGMAVPGVGYDCARFVRDCMAAAGVDTSAFDACPRVSLNHGRLHNASALVEWLHNLGGEKLRRVDELEDSMCGDIVCVRERLACHHLALAESPDWAWHVPYGGVVSRVPMEMFTQPRNVIAARYRILDV